MQKRQILINAITSVAQVVVTGIALFILYHFLLKTIGVEKLGIWSLVLAITSVANIANLGLSASGVKFVAKYLARGEEDTVVDLIQTLVIAIGIAIGMILLLAYPFADWLLSKIITGSSAKDAYALVPYALISLWISVISSVYQSGLDGYQRIDQRGMLLMSGAILHLVLCFILVPTHGLMGLAYARVSQTAVMLIGSWYLLKRNLPLLPLIPYRWNYSLFKEMLGYGINFQIVSISQMLYDPITKALLTKFGGLTMTGFYEMASRMIQQVRALLVSANQVLVPAIADLNERSPDKINSVYLNSYQLLFYLSLPLFSLIIVCSPIISHLWIGHYEMYFVIATIILAVGWFINTLAAPAYFANLGTGGLRWNTIGHIAIGLLNLGLGLLFGNIYGGLAVMVAWVFSLASGSLIIPVSYHVLNKIPVAKLLPKENILVIMASISGLSVSLLGFQLLNSRPELIVSGCVVLLFSSIVVYPVWIHPMRKRLMDWMPHLRKI